MSTRALCALALLGVGSGCNGCQPPPKPAAKDDAPAPSAGMKGVTGTVEGVVRFAGGDLPAYDRREMLRKILAHTDRGMPPETCSPPKINDVHPVLLTDDGLLSGVMIAASDFSHQRSVKPTIREVAIEDCRLTPRLVTATVGDTLRVINKVQFPFMPGYGQTDLVRTLIPGQTYDTVLEKPEVSGVTCGFTAPCGRTDVVTLAHPYHTVTDAQGKFRLEDLPADEPITLSAWHPLFREAQLVVEVGRGEQKRVELTIAPMPRVPVKDVPATNGASPGAAPSGATPAAAPAPTGDPAGVKQP